MNKSDAAGKGGQDDSRAPAGIAFRRLAFLCSLGYQGLISGGKPRFVYKTRVVNMIEMGYSKKMTKKEQEKRFLACGNGAPLCVNNRRPLLGARWTKFAEPNFQLYIHFLAIFRYFYNF